MLISLLKTKKVKKENIVSNRYRKMLTQQFSNKYNAESEKRVIEKYKKKHNTGKDGKRVTRN